MKSSRFPSKHVKDLDYADNIAVLVNHINSAETISTSAKHLFGLLEQQTPPNMAIKNFLKPILERSSYFG